MSRKIYLLIIISFALISGLLINPVKAKADTCTFPSENQSSLRAYAKIKNLNIGLLGGLNDKKLDQTKWQPMVVKESNLLVDGLWMDITETTDGQFNLERADLYANFAHAHNMSIKAIDLVFRLTTPSWVFKNTYSNDKPLDCTNPASGDLRSVKEIDTILNQWISTIVKRAGQNVGEWEVINEDIPNHNDLPKDCWRQILGDDALYSKAFQYAHAANPNAELSINDSFPNDPLITFASSLKTKGIPITTLNIEMHESIDATPSIVSSAMGTFMNHAKAAGFNVGVSEASVSTDQDTSDNRQKQADLYKAMVATCLAHSNCTKFIFWSNIDQTNADTPDYLKYVALWDKNYARKPSYYAVMDAFKEDKTRTCNKLSPGDLNTDGIVDFNDFTYITTNFVKDAYTIFDYNNLVTNYGK